jgi:hypothetical protein
MHQDVREWLSLVLPGFLKLVILMETTVSLFEAAREVLSLTSHVGRGPLHVSGNDEHSPMRTLHDHQDSLLPFPELATPKTAKTTLLSGRSSRGFQPHEPPWPQSQSPLDNHSPAPTFHRPDRGLWVSTREILLNSSHDHAKMAEWQTRQLEVLVG